MVDFTKLAALQAAQGKDLNKPTEGGGDDFEPPAAGNCRLRFIGYVEIGTHTTAYQGVKKTKARCIFFFELSGPRHAPLEGAEGKKMPHIITIRETIGTNEKNNYIKLFNLMKHAVPGAVNFVQLLGQAYRGVVVHEPKDAKDPAKGVYARLRDDAGFKILPVTYQDEETGEMKTVAVAPPSTPIRCFLWDYADTEQWDTLAAGGKSDWIRDAIRKADDFNGSPIFTALTAAGRVPELTSKAPAAGDQPATQQEAPATKPAVQAGPAVVTPTKPLAAVDDDIPW